MKISTKGRYAIRVMLDLAENMGDKYIPLMDIAERQEISEKYLESIVAVLSKNGMVKALRGKGGGYRLAREPREYTIGSILKLMENSMSPVACLDPAYGECTRIGKCKTLKMWKGMDELVENYFEGITLEDLMKEECDPE